MKKSIILTCIFIIILFAYSCSTYEDEYVVLKKIDSIEIREYPPALYVSYQNDLKGQNSQFQILADYIFGNNSTKEKIEMTSPVHLIQSKKKEMLFRIPKEYNIETLPKPNNPQIKFVEMGTRKVAAIGFSGYSNSDKINKMKLKLSSILNEKNIKNGNYFEVLVYDPPYKIINRRNELIVVL